MLLDGFILSYGHKMSYTHTKTTTYGHKMSYTHKSPPRLFFYG